MAWRVPASRNLQEIKWTEDEVDDLAVFEYMEDAKRVCAGIRESSVFTPWPIYLSRTVRRWWHLR